MGVDLCRGEVGMSEEFLYDAQVSTAIEQVSSKRMSQGVSVDIIWKICLRSVTFDQKLNTPS